ncbi:MBL fold metallo-hydrolase [Azospirillum picis]|uniref:Glyoxylase-like metal-dependent hydrolase (Beta-lactamase superfamily II) n=1 Tax=Azospirillum picis TaxID=488438 RepID=A0ABU0MP42_9PROT|nr:MBL fold metallo-hydrolase [Azospirillum picis]MBP2301408.1 glyoxylase-like metal-dependent hydrolase (beta-lactamase superfamily II) [Azospirillum picis]MDQ0535239.1 glyoxylase-like metal-dependent hydrolase (beta-lactamase superfamily II) [Azospirillum picis]
MLSTTNGAPDYPFCSTPEAGGWLEVAPGVLWIRLALPFQLDHVNVWALDGGDSGWTLVDCGLGDPRSLSVWEGLLRDALARRSVQRVVVTHFHPDHIGAAGWLVERTGAVFAASLTEWLLARALSAGSDAAADAAAERFYRRSGMAEEAIASMLGRKGAYNRGVPSVPPTLTRLRAGDRLTVGRHEWIVIGGSGHTAEPVSLYRPADGNGETGLLISGDQILPRISPNISVWPAEPDADPLADYLASLDGWSALPADTLVLPSHGRPFRGLHERARALADHHAERLEEIETLCATPRTAAAVTRALFPRPLDAQQTLFALGEAIAHLNHLIHRGRMLRMVADEGAGRSGADLYGLAGTAGTLMTR